MSNIRQVAIIGPTASGKSGLAIKLAKQIDAVILSIDSLAVYKQMDIVSAKPMPEEQLGIKHFGIDLLYPNQHFNVTHVIDLYHTAFDYASKHHQHLIIVGGSSFYLKSLLTGLSEIPIYSEETIQTCSAMLNDLPASYQFLYTADPDYMQQIEPSDRYRIEKLLLLYLHTKQAPSDYFAMHPTRPVITQPLPVYEIDMPRDILRDRVQLRTRMMLQDGLIDEIAALEARYGRQPNSMKAIGVIETLAYLDGEYSKDVLYEQIVTHTMQLAKRQTTFNRTQFSGLIKNSADALYHAILALLHSA